MSMALFTICFLILYLVLIQYKITAIQLLFLFNWLLMLLLFCVFLLLFFFCMRTVTGSCFQRAIFSVIHWILKEL